MFFKATQRVSQGQESTEVTDLQAVTVSALQPGHPSSYFLTRSSVQTLCNRSLHKGGARGCLLLCLYLQGQDQHGMMQAVAFDYRARAHLAWI